MVRFETNLRKDWQREDELQLTGAHRAHFWRALKRGLLLQITKIFPRRRTIWQSL